MLNLWFTYVLAWIFREAIKEIFFLNNVFKERGKGGIGGKVVFIFVIQTFTAIVLI